MRQAPFRRSDGLVSTYRGFRLYKSSQRFIPTPVSCASLRDQTHRKLVYRRFQFRGTSGRHPTNRSGGV